MAKPVPSRARDVFSLTDLSGLRLLTGAVAVCGVFWLMIVLTL